MTDRGRAEGDGQRIGCTGPPVDGQLASGRRWCLDAIRSVSGHISDSGCGSRHRGACLSVVADAAVAPG